MVLVLKKYLPWLRCRFFLLEWKHLTDFLHLHQLSFRSHHYSNNYHRHHCCSGHKWLTIFLLSTIHVLGEYNLWIITPTRSGSKSWLDQSVAARDTVSKLLLKHADMLKFGSAFSLYWVNTSSLVIQICYKLPNDWMKKCRNVVSPRSEKLMFYDLPVHS